MNEGTQFYPFNEDQQLAGCANAIDAVVVESVNLQHRPLDVVIFAGVDHETGALHAIVAGAPEHINFIMSYIWEHIVEDELEQL